MTTFTALTDCTCPRCDRKIVAGTTVRLVETPRGKKTGCVDCTGERRETLYAADNNRHIVRPAGPTAEQQAEQRSERAFEAAWLRRQGVYVDD